MKRIRMILIILNNDGNSICQTVIIINSVSVVQLVYHYSCAVALGYKL